MKFYRNTAATIAIYFSFTLLWMSLFINASEDGLSENIVTNNLENIIPQDDVQPPPVNTMKSYLFQSCPNKILSTILNEFLTIHEILILRKTCTDFKILLLPNEKNMVMLCRDFGSKEMDDVPLLWFDLKYFLNQSYDNALEKMEILNLKQNQYAVFTRDKKWISWHNEQALYLYPKVILNKLTNDIDYEPPRIYNKCGKAWAKLTIEENVISGGVGKSGSDSNHVQNQLKNVKMIATTYSAFAALLSNDRVIAWGKDDYGGKIPETLLHQNVKMIVSNLYAFAVLLHDGHVIAWGLKAYGGQISEHIQSQLQNVKMIFSNRYAFAALLHDGRIIAWGREDYGGKISEIFQPQLPKAKMIFPNTYAFVALLEDGSVIAWGRENCGGTVPKPIEYELKKIKPHEKKVKTIFSSHLIFTALLNDGSIITWGSLFYSHFVPIQIHVKMIFSNDHAFVFLLDNNHFVAWGDEHYGGKITDEIQIQLKNVKAIFSSSCAFAALLDDGSVFTWGDENSGGKIPEEVQSKLIKNVKTIFPQRKGFTALCNNGEMIAWGEY